MRRLRGGRPRASQIDSRVEVALRRLRRRRCRRFEHGSRVPGWDEAGRPREGPGADPRPRARRRAGGAARGDRGAHGQLPRPPLGRAAGARGRPARARLVLAGGDRAGGVRDARDARLPGIGGDLLRHARDRSRCAATACTCARTSPARCAAPTSCTRRCARRAGRRAGVNVRAFECLGACDIAPMASRGRRLRRPAVAPPTCRSCSRTCAPARPVLPESQLARRPVADPRRRASPRASPPAAPAQGGAASMARRSSAAAVRRTSTSRGCARSRCYERRGGYESLRKALAMTPEEVLDAAGSVRASAAAAARASRWARRSRSCRRARWTSTWCATPTSPSRAPSRTAN